MREILRKVQNLACQLRRRCRLRPCRIEFCTRMRLGPLATTGLIIDSDCKPSPPLLFWAQGLLTKSLSKQGFWFLCREWRYKSDLWLAKSAEATAQPLPPAFQPRLSREAAALASTGPFALQTERPPMYFAPLGGPAGDMGASDAWRGDDGAGPWQCLDPSHPAGCRRCVACAPPTPAWLSRDYGLYELADPNHYDDLNMRRRCIPAPDSANAPEFTIHRPGPHLNEFPTYRLLLCPGDLTRFALLRFTRSFVVLPSAIADVSVVGAYSPPNADVVRLLRQTPALATAKSRAALVRLRPTSAVGTAPRLRRFLWSRHAGHAH